MTLNPSHRTDRRTFLTGAGTTLGGLSFAALVGTPALADTGELPTLDPLPADQPDRTQFAQEEQRYAGYLAILAPMVNDIADDGFMDGGWRTAPPRRYNARSQEHVYTLAWFYANQRSWNPYHLDAALAARLDAALGYYLSLQLPNGAWTEGSPTDVGRSPTAFGMGYLSKTLAILRRAGALPHRHASWRRCCTAP